MFYLALLYEQELKDYDQAIIYYKKAIGKNHTNAMFGLAFLYEEKFKDYKQAIIYYKKAIEKDYPLAMSALASLYYKQNREKKQCLLLSEKAYSLEKHEVITYTLATAQLWNNHTQASIKTIKELLASPNNIEKYMDDITDYFLLLLAKQQSQAAYDLFQQFPDLKQQFKPVYYALMTLLKDQYPKEHLKMGSELKETVQEILEQIKKKAKRYR